MSLRALALNWRIDGPDATAFLVPVLVGATGSLYLLAAARGNSRDRRGRRWPRGRGVCFIAGLAVLVVDLYSGIGVLADERLSAYMLENMVIWVIVAPRLAAGAPVRLGFYSLLGAAAGLWRGGCTRAPCRQSPLQPAQSSCSPRR
jgi:cytochrome c oxidase assembly factor CtaG